MRAHLERRAQSLRVALQALLQAVSLEAQDQIRPCVSVAAFQVQLVRHLVGDDLVP
jgi:hypothetical protein